MNETSQIVYVQLLNEGTPAWRPTRARFIKDDIYELLPTEHYDPEDEEWEFVPGTIVHCGVGMVVTGETLIRMTAFKKAEIGE
jgi:hypothetical protein